MVPWSGPGQSLTETDRLSKRKDWPAGGQIVLRPPWVREIRGHGRKLIAFWANEWVPLVISLLSMNSLRVKRSSGFKGRGQQMTRTYEGKTFIREEWHVEEAQWPS